MQMSALLPDLIRRSAEQTPAAPALLHKDTLLNYGQLHELSTAAAQGFRSLGIQPDERIAIYLPKQPEAVIAIFGAAGASAVFVPINPVLKAAQVGYILRDCNVRGLITNHGRLESLEAELHDCPDLDWIALVDPVTEAGDHPAGPSVIPWPELTRERPLRRSTRRRIDADMAAILYTSGSTGHPKGVVLSHRNLVAGAESVAAYLENRPEDRILAVLPLSFDYGLSQLTTAFRSGASVALVEALLPRDVLSAAARYKATGLACVPPLWNQLARLEWPESARASMRYITNSGGAMPRSTLQSLRRALPGTRIYLMYGLTEAFRSTYLPPEELDRRPDSIGRPIPNAEVLVVRKDGTECAPDEEGELVHRGVLVARGYWNAPERTAERFRPTPGQPPELPLPELAVWSGDRVRRDAEGFLYFVGRDDDMIKSSGYRISPTEIEEVACACDGVAEAVALSVPHATLGDGIVLIVHPGDSALDEARVAEHCRRLLPNFMVPHAVHLCAGLPRNANGKIDRRALRDAYQDSLTETVETS